MNRKLLLCFRVGVLVLLLFLAARPVIVRPDSAAPAKWAVLLDVSRSMVVKDPVERLTQAKQITAGILKKRSGDQVFSFSSQVTAIPTGNVSALKADGSQSNIAWALKNILAKKEFKGAILLSDGRQVGAGDPVSEAVSAAKPIISIGLGDRSLFKDVAVRSVQSPPFAFKNIPVSIAATVSAIGCNGRRLAVRLRQGEKLLAEQTIEVSGSEVERTVTFSWTPESIGTKTLTVETDQLPDEVTNLNNRKSLTFDVGRDRFRVLYICGVPGPEYGMLRYQFKSDPAVELVTFVILRNVMNSTNLQDAELSLIPFPTQDVLIQQLPTFDLVVFEEFSYSQYGLMPNIMTAIRKRVEAGGAFLLMGGPAAFRVGSDYDISGVRDMIPVEFYGPGAAPVEQPFKFRVKALQHPVLRLDANMDQNKKIWQEMAELDGFVPVPAAKPGATVLGEAEKDGRSYPILTAWKFGQGRVAALATRTTWKWSMNASESNLTSGAYQQFWKNMVLWLARSEDTKNVRLSLEGGRLRTAESAVFRAWVFDEYFKPLDQAEVKLSIQGPDGKENAVRLEPEAQGVFSGTAELKTVGEHHATLWALHNGKKYGQDELTFTVGENHVEEEDLRPDPSLLRELSRSTGGQYYAAADFSVEAIRQFDDELKRHAGRKVLLWDSSYVFGVIIVLLMAEWIFRKRRGLL